MANKKKKQPPSLRRQIIKWTSLGVLALLLIVPYILLPDMDLPGTDVSGPLRPIDPSQCKLLLDVTAYDTNLEERVFHQQIFDEVLTLIRQAETFVYLDFFLWNSWQGAVPEDHRKLATELADALIQRKEEKPDLLVLALTDPINRIYGNDEEPFYHELAKQGIPVVFTDLDRLPASNLAYTPFERAYIRPFSRLPVIRRWFDRRAVKNLFDLQGEKISRRQVVNLLNFRANHRKVVIADDAEGRMRVVVTSFNPADGSSAHSNIGLLLEGPVARDALSEELKCVAWSAERPGQVLEESPGEVQRLLDALTPKADVPDTVEEPAVDQPAAQWLSEGAIRARLLLMLGEAGPGDQVDIGIFYLSDRDVVRAIADAAYAGADVRMIIDANRDAFGRIKNGVPNRPVAAELMKRSGGTGNLEIRWADTHGEQYHTKVLSVMNPDTGKYQLLCGSTNWTRRNIQDLNLEANVFIRNVPELSEAFSEYFERAWGNTDGLSYTLDYDRVAEGGWTLLRKTWMYRIQEATGLSTF